eukprot:GHVH01007279.1.p1 GENE.GHVH01007279.1~~GHVH01007279.1.p1  ORF type:complete len:421 (+),score=45.34 GHVH01007279.1:163-1425(+)
MLYCRKDYASSGGSTLIMHSLEQERERGILVNCVDVGLSALASSRHSQYSSDSALQFSSEYSSSQGGSSGNESCDLRTSGHTRKKDNRYKSATQRKYEVAPSRFLEVAGQGEEQPQEPPHQPPHQPRVVDTQSSSRFPHKPLLPQKSSRCDVVEAYPGKLTPRILNPMIPGITTETDLTEYWLLGLQNSVVRYWQFYIPSCCVDNDSVIKHFTRKMLSGMIDELPKTRETVIFVELGRSIPDDKEQFDFQVSVFVDAELVNDRETLRRIQDRVRIEYKDVHRRWIHAESINEDITCRSIPCAQNYIKVDGGRFYRRVHSDRNVDSINCDDYLAIHAPDMISANDRYHEVSPPYFSPAPKHFQESSPHKHESSAFLLRNFQSLNTEQLKELKERVQSEIAHRDRKNHNIIDKNTIADRRPN